jgi:hypothetical protein
MHNQKKHPANEDGRKNYLKNKNKQESTNRGPVREGGELPVEKHQIVHSVGYDE